MDPKEAARYWEANADAWTRLSRLGYDTYRDAFNTPAFFELLPSIEGLHGLDVGCGEGYNTRLLAGRGARVTALDVARTFLRHAWTSEKAEPLGLRFVHASGLELPFRSESFDFVTAFMSLMDMPQVERAMAEIHRVLRPGGFLQFSISHPCFDTPYRKNLRDASGRTYAYEIGDYFERRDGRVTEWSFSAAPREIRERERPFQTPYFTRPLSAWLNQLLDAGFRLERLAEPRPDAETVRRVPNVQDAQVVAYFLHVRARKDAFPRTATTGHPPSAC